MKNGRFEVGDKVVANPLADSKYAITRNGWKGVVIAIKENYDLQSLLKEDICVKDGGNEFWVNHKHFDLYKQEREKDKGIFIKGVSLPHCCGECVAFDSCGCKFINIDNSFNVWKNRAPNCPMKESK